MQPNQIHWEDYSTLKREIKRVKLALSRKLYKELLGKIDKANKDLRECTHQVRHLEPGRRQRWARGRTPNFALVRRHTKSLYNVMIKGKCWSCQCREQHMASLRLEPRPWENSCGEEIVDWTISPRFRIWLSTSHLDGAMRSQREYQVIEAEPISILLAGTCAKKKDGNRDKIFDFEKGACKHDGYTLFNVKTSREKPQ